MTNDASEAPTITAVSSYGRLHFEVRFPANGDMIRDIHTIPSRKFNGEGMDYKFNVSLAGSLHLMAFAEKYQIEAPPELIEDAARCPSDGLEILPQSARHLDFADGKFIARFPDRQIGTADGSKESRENHMINKDFRIGAGSEFNQRLRYWEVTNYSVGVAALKKIIKKWSFDVSRSAMTILYPGVDKLAEAMNVPEVGMSADKATLADSEYGKHILKRSNLPPDADQVLIERWLSGFSARIENGTPEVAAIKSTNQAYEKHLKQAELAAESYLRNGEFRGPGQGDVPGEDLT